MTINAKIKICNCLQANINFYSIPHLALATRENSGEMVEEYKGMRFEIENESSLPPVEKKNKCLIATKIMIIIVETIIVILILSIWDTIIAFEVIEALILVVVMKILFGFLILIPLMQRFFKLFNYDLRNASRKVKIILSVSALVFAILMYLNMILLKGLCICIWNFDTPGYNIQNVHISTAMGRSLYSSTCPIGNKPCLVYATLPENGLNGVFINFHINLESCKNQECHPIFEFRKYDKNNIDDQKWYLGNTIKGEYESPATEFSRRNIFTVLLRALNPNTTYIFRVTENSWDNSAPQLYSYKTFDTNNIVIINGGDVGNDPLAVKMNHNVVNNIKADMIMLGGDIAYDNNMPHCYQAWDYILLRLPHNYKDDLTSTIRVIPLVFASGNHDLGVMSYGEQTITHNSHEPAFKHYFPQNTYNEDVPKLKNRKTYFYHEIGDKLLILSLDVGYEATMEGEQKDTIDNILSKSKSKIKMAQYHGPIYTACVQDAHFDLTVISKGLEYWIPLFDKYNMTIVFENHTHAFKRSKKIKYGIPNNNGTIYLGEGNWGVTKPSGVCNPYNAELHDKVSIDQNVWIININGTNVINAKAYSNENILIDNVDILFD